MAGVRLGHFLADLLPLPTDAHLADERLKKAGELLHTHMLFLRLVTHDVSGATLELVDDGLLSRFSRL